MNGVGRTKFRGTMPASGRPTNATPMQFADAWIEAAADAWRESERPNNYWHQQTYVQQAIGAAEIARFWQDLDRRAAATGPCGDST